MSGENQNVDFKSLRVLARRSPGWEELAKDCVAFANAQGGHLFIGIEDGEREPPSGQSIQSELVEKARKRIVELTVNVAVAIAVQRSQATGGEYIEIKVPRSVSPASTSDGRYYLRVSDTSQPLVGEDVQRLLNERGAEPWEMLTTLKVGRDRADPDLLAAFATAIRSGARVKASVKEKSDGELLDHYYMAIEDLLTNLGVLCVGRREDRARLGTAPIVQFIKYDADGRKVQKIAWDDHALPPMQLIDAIWRDVSDFRETYELPAGLFRQHVPVYDQRVVRELLVNALVHRPYTQRGDIYLNMHPDRLEFINPGHLPLGVTPQNILHQSVRRNNELARVFHDLGLMEREGSGYDLLYEVLLSQGRPVPKVREGRDRVEVMIERRIVKPEVIELLEKADRRYELRQRERITLGLLAQRETMTARELGDALELSDSGEISTWLGRLRQWGIVHKTGRTKGTRYFVAPEVLRRLEFASTTSLSRIEPHRLAALVMEDLRRYPGSRIGETHVRIGIEISRRRVKGALDRLRSQGQVRKTGRKRGVRYWPT